MEAAGASDETSPFPSSTTSSSISHPTQYPTIDPTTFDLIVCGTGLPESLISAAAAAAAKSVLHLDPNPFYGSHFSSLSPSSLVSFLNSSDDHPSAAPHAVEDSDDHASFYLRRCPVYSQVETSGSFPESSHGFLLDLVGPRVIYCADSMVDLLTRSCASNHVEFKSVDATLMYWEGKLCLVPDSREAIFRDRALSLGEKSQMTKFLRLIQGHIASERSVEEAKEGILRIPAEDLERPFTDFLQNKRLPPKIKTMILYAIILANYDQEDAESPNNLILTKDGIESLALYTNSVSRFSNAVGAFIYPMYGHGELPQAFCRCAAVKGALYVLRMPVSAIIVDKETGGCKGIKLASGQDIFSQQVVLDSSFEVPSSMLPSNVVDKKLNSYCSYKVARGVCITTSSILPDSSNVLVIFPPKSLYPEQLTTVQVLQLSKNVANCPPGWFVVHLSTPCNDAILGKEYIKAAINALFLVTDDGGLEISNSSPNGSHIEEHKPALRWCIIYVQEQKQASFGSLCSCPMPDESLDYKFILEATKKLFTTMYPEDDFFPASKASDDSVEENPEEIES
ncbi:rab escort protein 1-like isoform X1 [Zingiber officinale]|uniref:rab escort protein 1-like isoform X1 n=1 Tax=Zingiber officinale TaxID=94328 RepID=UPI001C4D5FEB|nr:rab escort protein 1-like isoform X1 [Zingiber officinale]